MNIRFDSIKMPKMVTTKEGYLRGKAVVSRSGVFKYKNSDGSIRGELRHPDDVFKQDSLETLKMIPITNDHPPEFVSASNVDKYQVGYTGEQYTIDKDKIIVSMTVTHKDAIEAIKAGKLELSMGYEVTLKAEHGDYGGEHYDMRQLEPKYNHLAIVAKGRAGSEARFRFDEARELICDDKNDDKSEDKVRDDMTEQKENINNIGTRMANDANNAEITLLQSNLSELQNKLDAVEKELEQEKLLKTDSAIESRVIDRVSLITKAKPFLREDTELMSKTDRQIMEATINSIRGDDANFKNHSDDYVKGVFDSSIASAANSFKQRADNKGVYSVISCNQNDSNIPADFNSAVAARLEELKQNSIGE